MLVLKRWCTPGALTQIASAWQGPQAARSAVVEVHGSGTPRLAAVQSVDERRGALVTVRVAGGGLYLLQVPLSSPAHGILPDSPLPVGQHIGYVRLPTLAPYGVMGLVKCTTSRTGI